MFLIIYWHCLKIAFHDHQHWMFRTPDMCAMHHDSSTDLNVVGSKLKNILEVYTTLYSVWIKIFQQGLHKLVLIWTTCSSNKQKQPQLVLFRIPHIYICICLYRGRNLQLSKPSYIFHCLNCFYLSKSKLCPTSNHILTHKREKM